MVWQQATGGYICPEKNATIMKYEDGYFLTIWNRSRTAARYAEGGCPSLEYAKKAAENFLNGEDGKTAFVVCWTRETYEQNYFYCDSFEQAENFKKALEESNNGKVNFISEVAV